MLSGYVLHCLSVKGFPALAVALVEASKFVLSGSYVTIAVLLSKFDWLQ